MTKFLSVALAVALISVTMSIPTFAMAKAYTSNTTSEVFTNAGLTYTTAANSDIEFSAFKLFLLDVGLLGALSDLDMKSILEGNSIFVEFKGALTEQYVLQQLIAETEYTPYYFAKTKSEGEIDFLIQKNSDIVPIEVKAEENLRARSLRAFKEKYQPEIAIRSSMSNYREQEWMTNVPLFMLVNYLKNVE